MMNFRDASNALNRASNAMLAGLKRDYPDIPVTVLLAALGYLAAKVLEEFPADQKEFIATGWIDTVKAATGLEAHASIGFGTRH